MRTVRRLRLLCFACRPRYSYYQRLALIQNRVSVVAYRVAKIPYSCRNRSCVRPIKSTHKQTLLHHYRLYHRTISGEKRCMCFWWTWRALPPRLTTISDNQFTTIKLYYTR